MGKVTRLFCWRQDFGHKGLSAPASGLYTCGKTLKMCLKSYFKEIILRAFCWHQKFVSKGFSALSLGLFTCIKSLKNVYKIRFQRDHFETCNIWAKIKGLSVDINFCPQGLVCPCPGAIFMYKSIKIYSRTRCQVSVYRTTGPLIIYY